jgi:hypothetical protein
LVLREGTESIFCFFTRFLDVSVYSVELFFNFWIASQVVMSSIHLMMGDRRWDQRSTVTFDV